MAIKARFVDCLVTFASWMTISVGAGAAAAHFTRQLGSFTYIALGLYLAIIGSLTHCLLRFWTRHTSTAVGSWLRSWAASLTLASLLVGFLVLRHPQHAWVVRSFANLWITFATPTAALCAGVATALHRTAGIRAFAPDCA